MRALRRKHQNAIVRGGGIFLERNGIGNSISNITERLREMEDLKSPLDLAVNKNTVSIRGQIQNTRYQGVECENDRQEGGSQASDSPGITSVSCYQRSSNTTSTVLPAKFSYFYQPGDPLVGRNRSNSSSCLTQCFS